MTTPAAPFCVLNMMYNSDYIRNHVVSLPYSSIISGRYVNLLYPLVQYDIKKMFDVYDQKGDGKIAGDKIGSIVRANGLKMTQEALIKAQGGKQIPATERVEVGVVEKVFNELNKDKANKEAGSANDFKEVLKVFDKAGKGKIPLGELKHTLASLGEMLEPWEVNLCTAGLEDPDGNIKIDDFVSKITNV